MCIYLDIKSKKKFDREIAEELYEHMDKDHNGKVTIREFIRVFVEADDVLNKKMISARDQSGDLH